MPIIVNVILIFRNVPVFDDSLPCMHLWIPSELVMEAIGSFVGDFYSNITDKRTICLKHLHIKSAFDHGKGNIVQYKSN